MVQTLRHFHYSREQIELLFNSKFGTLGVNFVTPLIFFVVYIKFIPFGYLFIWLVLQLLVFMLRVGISKRGLKAIEQLDQKAIKENFYYYLATIFSNALLWGSVSILVLYYTDQTLFFIYIIVLFGLGAAGTSSIGVVFHAIVIFLVNTLILASIAGLYYSSTPIDYLLCLFILIYFFFMLKIGFRNHSFIATNIEQKEQIINSHKLIKESIEYAALIQKAMLPQETTLDSYFKEHFVYLKQRDIVGGDFYSVVPLADDELLIMIFDGVGHGVSGAFMTMLIKATEQQIMAEVQQKMLEPTPAMILLRFNVLIKTMIQDQCDNKTFIGFDGGILHFDRTRSLAHYASAKMPLYVIQNGTLSYYKGDRKGVGFERTPMKQEFTEYTIPVTADTKFYFATDGLLDQEGEDGTRFGAKRFEAFLWAHHEQSLMEQYQIFQGEIETFSGTKAQLDDMTVLGFSF